ncbi:hypothetical protein SteCoe_33351 [Stentor coeruleus]|uniref:G domain-containing protein n=1 Tax=Stentor coeruleus TaxID=5963 RepID=A0A1R2AX00_9CILI|nr:hypothetical protein SteCoe_33351 [Stentor coeruleus]
MNSTFAKIIEKSEIEPYDYSILLLGGSGTGKSTLVKEIIVSVLEKNANNYLEAIEISGFLKFHSNDYFSKQTQENDIHNDDNNVKFIKVSGAITNFKTVLLIDTPGFELLNFNKNEKILLQIIQAVQCAKTFNAICIINRFNNFQLNATLNYIFSMILKAIPSNFRKNIIMIETFATYEELNSDISCYPTTIQNVFFFNNDLFCLERNEINQNPKKKITINMSLKKSAKKLKAMFDFIFKMEAISTLQYNELFIHYPIYYSKISEYEHHLKSILKLQNYMKENFNIEIASKIYLMEKIKLNLGSYQVIANGTQYNQNLNNYCKIIAMKVFIPEKCLNNHEIATESIQELLELFSITIAMKDKDKIDGLIYIKLENLLLDIYQQELIISEIAPF